MARDDRIERRIAAILLAVLAVGCLVVLRPFLSAVFWAAILSSSTWPLYARLKTLLRGRRAAAAAGMVAAAAIVFLLPLALLIARVAGEVTQLAAVVSHWMEAGPPAPPHWVATLPLVGTRLDGYWRGVADNGAQLAADMKVYVVPARQWLLASTMKLGAGLTELVLALLISFFFYRDGAAGLEGLRAALVRIGGSRAKHLLAIAGATIKSVVYGVLGTAAVQATLAAIGLRIAGVPAPLLLGAFLFFLTVIPLAPALVFVPAIIWLAQQGATGGVIFLCAWYVVVFVLLEAALRPYLISRGSDLPLILVLLGMFGGIAAFGLLGIFLGPVLLALGHALAREWSLGEDSRAQEDHRETQPAQRVGAS
jgi:predicted PurR-regulated permease PerM